MKKIIIYADGGCRGNGKEENIGGWGATMEYKGKVKEIYGAVENTTNNQMELQACIESLKAIKTSHIPIEFHCDSAYVVNGMTEWVRNWVKRGWKTKDGKQVKNKEFWQELFKLSKEQDEIKFIKVSGHSGVELNERADELVNIAMDEWEANNK